MRKYLYSGFLRKAGGSICLLLLIYCFVSLDKNSNDTLLRLRFNLNYKGDAIERQKTGLAWALSYLGAELPKNSLENSLKPIEHNLFELNVNTVGFNKNAVAALKKIIRSLKESEEYRMMGGIDLGEFVVYTVGSSWHYYEITGADKNYSDHRKKYRSGDEIVFPVLNSEVAKHHRFIKIWRNSNILKGGFIAEEGEGDIHKNTFVPQTFEVIQIMKNGQLRFAIYGRDGRLQEASEVKFGSAGKPVKCMWCHEIVFQPLYTENDSLANFISPRQFQQLIAEHNEQLDDYRKTLNSDIDFSKKQDHALMELLYINYMQPSPSKLAKEWGQNELAIENRFKLFKKHDHEEYKFMVNLMERHNVKEFSPYKTVDLPDSVRNPSNSEPNIFYQHH